MEATPTIKGSPTDRDMLQRLQDENAVLRAELQAIRSATQPKVTHSNSHSHSGQTFDFFRIPKELSGRNI
jgi:hypothetical protein